MSNHRDGRCIDRNYLTIRRNISPVLGSQKYEKKPTELPRLLFCILYISWKTRVVCNHALQTFSEKVNLAGRFHNGCHIFLE